MERAFLIALLLACSGATPAAPTAPTAPSPEGGVLAGLCEASSVVADEGGWLVADNETPDRLFRFDAAMAPAGEVRLSDPVDDAEALAPSPLGVWVVGSQSANKEGKARPSRERLGVLGKPAVTPDLSACAPCLAARGRAPNDGGLNVEGAAWLGDRLWLGLRGPLVGGKALLLETTSSPDGIAVTRVVEADLGGGAVRELVAWKGGLLVVTGPVGDSDAGHALWWLSAPDAPPKRLALDLPPSSEGLAIGEDGAGIVVMDGDGKPGEPCRTPARWQRVKVPAP